MLELKESVLDPIRRFMSGPNHQLYAEARQYIQAQEPSLSCVEGDDGAAICGTLDDPACYKGNGMQEVKSRLERLKAAIEERVQAEAQTAASAIANLLERLTAPLWARTSPKWPNPYPPPGSLRHAPFRLLSTNHGWPRKAMWSDTWRPCAKR